MKKVAAITVAVYFLFVWYACKPLFGYLFLRNGDEKGLLSAIASDGGNPAYHYFAGRFYQYDIEKADIEKAIRYYEDSIRLNPLQGGCWLDLARARRSAGFTKEADYAIRRSVGLLPGNSTARWEAALFYLAKGNYSESFGNFKEFILLEPGRQDEVYDLLWRVPVAPDRLSDDVVPRSYPYYKNYLIYLISSGRTEDSLELWQTMKGSGVESELLVRYTDYLIDERSYDRAEEVWSEYLRGKVSSRRDETELVRNGSFEYEMLNGGFDWKIAEAKGADVFLDNDIRMLGRRSLGITFNGQENPNVIFASQVVKVAPGGRYILKGSMKTQAITTANGPFISVTGHKCSGLNDRSEAITGTNFWQEILLDFQVPPDCGAIRVAVSRERSEKFNNRISGSAWVDGISLIPH